jgi:DNA-binding Lrp family transcriptional regulator
VRGETVSGEGLSAFEKRLCNILQNGLPISKRPYEEIGKALGSDEEMVLEGTRRLVKRGVIRRIGAVVNWRAIGKASTLVTACIAEGKLKKVVEAVNQLEGVSHNYLRRHHFNLWFTLRADSQKEITATLKKLSKQFGVTFHSLPVVRIFKLDVRFDAESDGRSLLPRCGTPNTERCPLNAIDKRILAGLEGGLKVAKRPFDFISEDEFEIADGLLHIEEMIQEGVISRLGAIVNHHKLGFVANAMFVCKVGPRQRNARAPAKDMLGQAGGARVIEVGQKLAELNIVSHCYERKIFKGYEPRGVHSRPESYVVQGWPYNLFAMMHGRSLKDIRRVVERFVKLEGLEKWEVLETVEKLRK